MKKKHSEKYSLFSRYLNYLRKSSTHAQHVHAVVFSGAITLLIAWGILYFDYGFWRERYDSNKVAAEEKIQDTSISPTAMFSEFVKEVGGKVIVLKSGGNALIEGRETYSQKEEFLRGTSSADGQ